MSTEYGSSQGTSRHGAAIERPGGEDLRTEVARAADAAADAVEQTAEKVRGYLQSAVDQARHKMAEYREHGWGRVQGDVVASARAQPLAAIGIAAAVGFLLWRLGSMARR